ncbi:hypothetical protein ISS06_01360 [Patescibacteria group bacterium]|nr:hypothetical protein [Patescibacteria group bacterium]
MSEKTKKILLVILFILVVIGMAWLLYSVFFKKPVVLVAPDIVEELPEQVRLPVTQDDWEAMTVEQRVTNGLPKFEWLDKEISKIPAIPVTRKVAPKIDEIAKGGKTWVSPVSIDKVKWPTLAKDGLNSIYYNPETGQFFEVDIYGNKTLMTDQVFYNVDNVNWAPTKERAIIEYPDGFKVMYDFKKKKQYTLPKNWEDFSWDIGADKIAFKSISKYAENTWLAIARPDGSKAKPIEHMGENADKVTVSWSPNNQVVAFSSTGDPRGMWEQEMLLIGQHGENFKSLVIDGRRFEPKWAPNGSKIVYSVYSSEFDYKPRLYVVDAQGDDIGRNKISTGLETWAHKCTFNSNGAELYCAVPKTLPDGAGMIEELGEGSRDNFYKINVSTGEVSFLAEGAMGGYDVKDIYVSNDDKYLYFVDENSSRLRYIKLK